VGSGGECDRACATRTQTTPDRGDRREPRPEGEAEGGAAARPRPRKPGKPGPATERSEGRRRPGPTEAGREGFSRVVAFGAHKTQSEDVVDVDELVFVASVGVPVAAEIVVDLAGRHLPRRQVVCHVVEDVGAALLE
jgi:hypothetical protein